MKLDMLKPVHHVQRTKIFTSTLHSFQEGKFVSKYDMKQHFFKGIQSASANVTRSYAQVVRQGAQKNALASKQVSRNVGIIKTKEKVRKMNTHAESHKVAMCKNSMHIKPILKSGGSRAHRDQLMSKYQKRHVSGVLLQEANNFSVPTKNRFDSLVVEPLLEDSGCKNDRASVVTHTHARPKHAGSNHSGFDAPLMKHVGSNSSGIETTFSHTCPIVDSNAVDIDLPIRDKCVGLNLDSGYIVDNSVSAGSQTGKNANLSLDRTVAGTKDSANITTTGHNKVLQKAQEQIGTAFGCLPLSTIKLFTGDPTYYENIPDIIQIHKLVKQSGVPNFLGLRIPIPTQLKVDRWRYYLRDYFDQQLPDLLEFGFPLDFDRSCDLGHTIDNHNSANDYPEQVHQYIQEEIKHNAILGPFQTPPFDLHISPFMTREKMGSSNRRTIIDLSWPKGLSVNDGVSGSVYLGTHFELKYPSIDHMVSRLNALGPAAKIFKVDISRAFRHVRFDLGDIDLLGLRFRDQYFADLALPFGFRLGSIFFSKLSDSIRYIMTQHGYPHLHNYIDDFLYYELPSKIQAAYEFLLHLLQELGLDISQKKLHPPDTQVVCLGILFDTINRTISIPVEKLQEIIQTCNQWSDKRSCTKNQLQSLLGSLLYITKCVRPARYFLNRMLQVLRDNVNVNRILLPADFHKDLNWFLTFLNSYNGVTIYDIRPISGQIYLDACLTGLGGSFKNMVYTIPLPVGFENYSIVHLEMVNIVAALKIWGPMWRDTRIQIYCDNLAVVQVLNSGGSRDSILSTCARNVWLLSALYNISIQFSHIAGAQNTVADLLSRWTNTVQDFIALNAHISDPVWMNAHIDLTLLNYHI